MFAGIGVGGWDRGVGEVVVFSMGTRLLTAANDPTGESYTKKQRYGILQTLACNGKTQAWINCNKTSTHLP